MSEPRPYHLDNPEELKRFFREMKGYLKVERFLEQGTDAKGRLYALHAFEHLERKIEEWRCEKNHIDKNVVGMKCKRCGHILYTCHAGFGVGELNVYHPFSCRKGTCKCNTKIMACMNPEQIKKVMP